MRGSPFNSISLASPRAFRKRRYVFLLRLSSSHSSAFVGGFVSGIGTPSSDNRELRAMLLVCLFARGRRSHRGNEVHHGAIRRAARFGPKGWPDSAEFPVNPRGTPSKGVFASHESGGGRAIFERLENESVAARPIGEPVEARLKKSRVPSPNGFVGHSELAAEVHDQSCQRGDFDALRQQPP
ncbi:hypothetical protein SBA5_750008 [Candidatus Sulfotelmatomonas gaucii]|uniref:Uncharacterized protein n=1 Tax=Candidatus Sulfuritelmatomonas gaucii TaxID=2043161 RepID=A0A2N9M3N4_9BACT|nr:hypothetical protein SBA5_750008 [Candidatus Sulfotelmatomonas gaucii]